MANAVGLEPTGDIALRVQVPSPAFRSMANRSGHRAAEQSPARHSLGRCLVSRSPLLYGYHVSVLDRVGVAGIPDLFYSTGILYVNPATLVGGGAIRPRNSVSMGRTPEWPS
jgi:hypothetical protein